MNQEIIDKNFNNWKTNLENCNLDGIVNLYAVKSIFLPTKAGGVKTTREEAKKYFEGFFLLKPIVSIIEQESIFFNNDKSYLHSGLYHFKTKDSEIVKARFSYVWQKIDDDWVIMHHHSSLEP